MSKLKKIPEFKTEADERAFWESHDSGDYVDWTQAQPASFPKLKLPTKIISLDAVSIDIEPPVDY